MSFSEQDKARALAMASKMADDFDQEKAAEFASQHEDKNWYENFKLLLHMMTHPGYSLSPTTWAVIAGALAYVVSPIDIIPDFIPVLGWLDDGIVLAAVIASLSSEINSFKSFLTNHQMLINA